MKDYDRGLVGSLLVGYLGPPTQGRRAYLSTTDSANRAVFAPHYPEVAEREARAILAETEPAGAPDCDHGPARVLYARGQRAKSVRHWTPRQDVKWEASKALAEALAAFVAMDL